MNPDQIFSHWKQIRADLLSIFEQFDDSELAYQPFEGSWPVGQIMLHIAEAEEGWFHYVVTHELEQWPEYQLANYPRKEDIRQVLRAVHTRTEAYLAALDEAQLTEPIVAPRGEQLTLYWITWHVIEHEIHHRGELSLCLGLLGREGWGA
jgi:uncharacterized damage-inducible protein DinB